MSSIEQMIFGPGNSGRPASNPVPPKPAPVVRPSPGYMSIDPRGSLNAESTLLPIEHDASLTNHFGAGKGPDPVMRDFKQSPARNAAKVNLGLNP